MKNICYFAIADYSRGAVLQVDYTWPNTPTFNLKWDSSDENLNKDHQRLQ